jgi:hypothetical protein
MARVNGISDGQPLTYELLNQIISEVNKIKDVPEDFGQNVEVYGPSLGMSEQDTVKVVSDVHQFDIKAKDITVNLDVKFKRGGNFSKDNIVVVASIVDRAFGKSGGGAQMANVTITNITTTGFEARVQILKQVKQNISLELHYIAIGAGPRVSS